MICNTIVAMIRLYCTMKLSYYFDQFHIQVDSARIMDLRNINYIYVSLISQGFTILTSATPALSGHECPVKQHCPVMYHVN